MNCIEPGSEAAGPLKLRKGWHGRRSYEAARIVDRRPMAKKPFVPVVTSLDELEAALRQYGIAARLEATLRAVDSWRKNSAVEVCRHPKRVVTECIRLCRERSFVNTGLLLPNGKQLVCILDRLDTELQDEAVKVMGDTLADWKSAGAMGLTFDRINDTHRFFRSAILKTKTTNMKKIKKVA